MALYAQILNKEGDKTTALAYLRKASQSIKDPDLLTLAGNLEYSLGDRKKQFLTGLKHQGLDLLKLH